MTFFGFSRATGKYAAALALTALVAVPFAAADAQRTYRKIPGYKWGRCLLEVNGKAYISGACTYQTYSGGGFMINGPRQIFPGVDYPRPRYQTGQRSADYFAQVNIEGRTGEAYWNEQRRATHAHSNLGTVRRDGACWVNARTRICVWKR